MNAFELQALRQIFSMTVEECAMWIAPDYNIETWHQWENGSAKVPSTIVEKLLTMRQKRKSHINAIIEKINNRIGNNTMRFFDNLADFQVVYREGDFLDWKIYQSVAAELYAHELEHLC
ncbi:hypothetical protein CJP72_23835 [Citrobacter sp. NCU1]|uniref:YdiL family protein n=1 Tax=Citrobacter sp. NCU1 TaxID=2026683 RepID=UPI001391867B|nr:YdiL family protein [Citrobacter sp. NCU1]NDO83668.1 hypothetical protein [Citrobacter sp. NCU1]